jgi:hypothetical protein
MLEHQSDAVFYCIIAQRSRRLKEEFSWLALGSIKWTDKETGCFINSPFFCIGVSIKIYCIVPTSWILNPSWLQPRYPGILHCESIKTSASVSRYSALWNHHDFSLGIPRYSALLNYHDFSLGIPLFCIVNSSWIQPGYTGILHCEFIMTSAWVYRYSALWIHHDFSLGIPVFCIVNSSWLRPRYPGILWLQRYFLVLYIVNHYGWNLL